MVRPAATAAPPHQPVVREGAPPHAQPLCAIAPSREKIFFLSPRLRASSEPTLFRTANRAMIPRGVIVGIGFRLSYTARS